MNSKASEFEYLRLFQPDHANFSDTQGLIDLGSAMVCDETRARAIDDSRIPAGYTYLSHIVAHDLTFDRTEGMPEDPVPDDSLANGRGPALDLSSIFGCGPSGVDAVMYESDGVRLKLGPVDSASGVLWEDLPRDDTGLARIGDERNDENVATAQTLVLLIKFHNRIVDHLEKTGGKTPTFDEARNCTVQHFQSVVLHDLVWRIVPDNVYHDVMDNGRKLYYSEGLTGSNDMALPIEFSHAAFRFGHAMVRSSYRWNNSIEFASPAAFFRNSGRNSSTGFRYLHSDWVAEWSNFYPLHVSISKRKKEFNYSRKINTQLTNIFGNLPHGELINGEPPNLAVRDLLRGRTVCLPSGQQAAREVLERYQVYINRLSPHELQSVMKGRYKEILCKHGFDRCTPLWFYLLAEAELEQHGESLGQLGGRMVMETLHASIESVTPSILTGDSWKSSVFESAEISMADLISFVMRK